MCVCDMFGGDGVMMVSLHWKLGKNKTSRWWWCILAIANMQCIWIMDGLSFC